MGTSLACGSALKMATSFEGQGSFARSLCLRESKPAGCVDVTTRFPRPALPRGARIQCRASLGGPEPPVEGIERGSDVNKLRQAQRAVQTAKVKVEEEIARRLGIEEPLGYFMVQKGKEIRWDVVSAAESACNGVAAYASRPLVKRCVMGFIFFYAVSVVWAARILLFDKKSGEARERFGRELRLQKLREAGASSPIARAPLDFAEIKVNGQKVPSANDEDFIDKVRKIQEMARAVRVAEQEVFSPSESGFVSMSGKGPIPESEKQKPSVPSNGKNLRKMKKQKKQVPFMNPDEPVGLDSKVSAKVERPRGGSEQAKLVREPEPSLNSEPLRAVVDSSSAIEAKAAENVCSSDTSQNQVSAIDALDSIAARTSDAQIPFKGGVVPPLNVNSKLHRSPPNGFAKDEKPTPASGEGKVPRNSNVTPESNGAARAVPSMNSQPQKFKSMRVITSPEEARARIAARKAKDGGSSAKAVSTRPTFQRINIPDLESVDSDADDIQSTDEAGSKEKEKGSASAKAGAKSTSSQDTNPEPKSAAEEEEEAWMRDEVLRNIVLKVRDNEEAGRESFHGLDSAEEQKFFKGLERKFEREGDVVKNWIQDRVENLDYGVGGVGLDDPPEVFVARMKGPEDPERAKRYAKFQDDRRQILEKRMGGSTPAQATDDAASASTSSSSPSPAPKPFSAAASKSSQEAVRPASASTSSSSPLKPAPTRGTTKKDEAKERLQSNASASGSKTVVTSTGKQSKPVAREWQHTKKWGQDLQRKYDLETDKEKRALMNEVGQDLDRWITEDEIEEANRLLSQGVPGEEEYVRLHYEKTREKIRQQHETYGSGGMLNKYGEYKEEKKEPELWWLDLPYVLVIGVTTSADDGSNSGFYSLDMTPDFSGLTEDPMPTCNHTVAFQDQQEALNFCGLLLSEQYTAEVIPVPPKDLYSDAKDQGFKVTVIKKGQLGLVPGQALDDVEQRLIDIGSAVYWEELERDRSIDMDAVLDEGLGYGRPSR